MDPAWITALIALTGAVVAVLAWTGRHAWRAARRVARFLDDYQGQPARDGLPERPGIMARLSSVEELVAHVAAETRPNHGASLRDVVHQTAQDVADIKAQQTGMWRRMEHFETQHAGREGEEQR
jgi:hypothetical protein